MIKNVVTSIGGIGLFGVVSVCLFFVVFTGVILFAVLKRRTFLTYMEALPLADDSPSHTHLKGEPRHE
jgi:hypothetical protein